MKSKKPMKNKAKRPPKRGFLAKKQDSKSEIYLDYASATPVSASVEAAMASVRGLFANPGGIHGKSVEAKKAVENARRQIAELIEARPSEIVFTASATESNTLAIRGALEAWQKLYPNEIPHIIISSIEHPSIMELADILEDEGVLVSRIGVDEYGIINLPELKASLQKNTVIVSIMNANNEIGTIEPLDAITKTLRHYKKEIKTKDGNADEFPLLHTDASQSFHYLPSRVVKPGVDFMTISSGKIYGPRGIALLYVKTASPFLSPMPGGGQEKDRRGGTEATSLIIGFAKAMEDAVKMREKENGRLIKILEAGKIELARLIPEAKLLGHPTNRLPNNLAFSITGIESDYLVLALSAKKIYASSRSACSAAKEDDNALDSHVILSIGGNPLDGTIRLSFGRDTVIHDVRKAIQTTRQAIDTWKTWSHAHKN